MRIKKYKIKPYEGISYTYYGIEGREITDNAIIHPDKDDELFLKKTLIQPAHNGKLMYSGRFPGSAILIQFSDGNIEYALNNRRFILKPGQFTIINLGQHCQCRMLDDNSENMWKKHKSATSIIIGGKYFQDIFNEIGINLKAGDIEFTNTSFEKSEHFRNISSNMLNSAEMNIFGKEVFFQSLLYQFMLYLLNNCKNTYSGIIKKPKSIELYDPRIEKVIDYIKDNYSESFSLDELSKVSALSKNHLMRLFRKRTGFSPWQYLTAYRMSRAINMLKNTKLNISEVSAKIGYHDLRRFERLFKLKTKISPLEFKNAK